MHISYSVERAGLPQKHMVNTDPGVCVCVVLGKQLCGTYRVRHAVVQALVLGHEAPGAIWRVGQLGAMHELMGGGSTSASSTPSATRGVTVGEVKIPVAMVTVAWKHHNRHGGFRLEKQWPHSDYNLWLYRDTRTNLDEACHILFEPWGP